jgi:hypothetical protein
MKELKLSPDLRESFEHKIGKLIKTALKHGLNLSYEISELKYEKIDFQLESYYIVKVNYDTVLIQYENFEYIATLEKTEGGNMVFRSDNDLDLSSYFDVKFYCDHCNTIRDRKKVHLFQDTETKEIIQIASSCAKEYFGVNIAMQLDNYTKLFVSIQNLEEVEYFKHVECIDEILNKAFYVIYNDKRYYSKAKPDNNGMTTIDIVNAIVVQKIDDFEAVIKLFNIDSFYEYWTNKIKTDNSEFTRNIFLSLTTMSTKKGLVVYSVFDYLLNGTELIKKKETKVTVNEFFGAVKDKISFECEIIRVSSFDTKYGTTFIYTIQSKENYIFSWSTNKFFDNGTKGTITGTIKEHSTYKEQKQTKITRCKIVA